jgi:hypothetical protein
MSAKKRVQRKKSVEAADAVVITVEEMRRLLGVGRAAAYRLAKRLGVRIGGPRGRLLVARTRLDNWLRGQKGGAS